MSRTVLTKLCISVTGSLNDKLTPKCPARVRILRRALGHALNLIPKLEESRANDAEVVSHEIGLKTCTPNRSHSLRSDNTTHRVLISSLPVTTTENRAELNWKKIKLSDGATGLLSIAPIWLVHTRSLYAFHDADDDSI